MSASEATLKALREIGLTEYETAAYLTLVDGGEMSASDVSSKSTVPFSRVYDVLGRLESRGFIQLIKGRPTLYLAKAPSEVVKLVQISWTELLEKHSKVIVDELQPRFEQETPATTRDVWLLHGRSAILAKALETLESTREELLLSIPSLDVSESEVKSIVEGVLTVKVKVKILTSSVPRGMQNLIPSNFEVRTRERVFGAGVVSDRKHTLIMLAQSEDDAEFLGIYSSHFVFAEMASAYFESLWTDSIPL
ncbi:MAG: helix-turn-helix domain-containing protein [Candidatus Thorarchaeota archaeon]